MENQKNELSEVTKMVKSAKEIFLMVEKVGEELRTGERKDQTYYVTTLDTMTGCFTYLYPRFKKIEALKLNSELGTYAMLKNQAALEGTKFTDAATSKEASLSVKDLRLARSLFDGYQKASENAINTCKRQLSAIEEERNID